MGSPFGAVAVGVMAAIAAAGCSTPSPVQSAPHAAVTTMSASAAAVASAPSGSGPWRNWCFGTGFTDLETVVSDLQAITTDSLKGESSTTAADGQTLVADAARGELSPPPESRVQAAAYTNWMKQVGDVGAAWAQYDATTAIYAARASQKYKAAVLAANNRCVSMGAP